MEKLLIKHTSKTPEIDFNPAIGLFQISGVSVPENAIDYYLPILSWLKEYTRNPQTTTIITFKLSYINTSSLQYLYDILIELSTVTIPPCEVIINWHYAADDLDMKETGEDFKDSINLIVNLIES